MSAPRFDPTLLYGRSDFGEFEARTRRMLALEGLIPLDLGRAITPVMLLGDASLPGFGQQRLRRFAAQPRQGGVGTGFWWKCEATEGVIIDQLRVTLTTAGVVRVRYLGSQDTDPVAIATAGGIMIDRATTGSEVSPLTTSAVADASAIVAANQIYDSQLNIPVGAHVLIDEPFYLAFGAKLAVGGTQAVSATIRGRTF